MLQWELVGRKIGKVTAGVAGGDTDTVTQDVQFLGTPPER